MINRYAVIALLGTLFENTTFNPSAYQADTENIYAGYGQYTTTIGKLGILAGVRVEATDANYGAYQFVTDASGNMSPILRGPPGKLHQRLPYGAAAL